MFNLRFLVQKAAVTCAMAALFGFASVLGQTTRFDGESIVEIDAPDEAAFALVEQIVDDIWTHDPGPGAVQVRVDALQRAALEASGFATRIVIPDLQALIDAQASVEAGRGLFDAYQNFASVRAHVAALEAQRPDLAQRITIGQSVQNRPIELLRITGPGDATGRPGILVHGGQHAREWITVAVAQYLADRLVTSYDTDPQVRNLVDRVEWFILPVMNPDGYVYTWTNNRLWRKNRRQNSNGSFGVDLNRNWGYEWGGPGSSGAPNQETYRGPSPFSEPETQAVRDFLLARPEVVGYFDLHSYSQLLMWPWGYTSNRCPDHPQFLELGERMMQISMAVHGVRYVPGPIYTTIYPASGGSVDWVYGTTGALAMTYELRDTGTFGFLLPAEQIVPTSEEIFPALMHYADQVSAPVRFRFPEGLPGIIAPSEARQLRVAVEPQFTSAGIQEVRIYSQAAPGSQFVSQALVPAGEGEYLATLGGGQCGDSVAFYFEALRTDGVTWRSPGGAPVETYTFRTGQIAASLADDFSQDQGWGVNGIPALGGIWRRGVPTGTMFEGQLAEPEGGNSDGSGGEAFVTQPATNEDPESSDVDGGPIFALGPALSLADLNVPVVEYSYWLFTNAGETLSVEISSDLVNWQPIAQHTSGDAWRRNSFFVRDYLPVAETAHVRFGIADQTRTTITEAAIDDFVLGEFTCVAALPGDMNCDGVLSVGDIAGFVLALTDPAGYAAQYPNCSVQRADMDGNGQVSVSDIGLFVQTLGGK